MDYCSAFAKIILLVLYVTYVSINIYDAVTYNFIGHYWWAILTMIITFLPMVFTSGFVIKDMIQDSEDNEEDIVRSSRCKQVLAVIVLFPVWPIVLLVQDITASIMGGSDPFGVVYVKLFWFMSASAQLSLDGYILTPAFEAGMSMFWLYLNMAKFGSVLAYLLYLIYKCLSPSIEYSSI